MFWHNQSWWDWLSGGAAIVAVIMILVTVIFVARVRFRTKPGKQISANDLMNDYMKQLERQIAEENKHKLD